MCVYVCVCVWVCMCMCMCVCIGVYSVYSVYSGYSVYVCVYRFANLNQIKVRKGCSALDIKIQLLFKV